MTKRVVLPGVRDSLATVSQMAEEASALAGLSATATYKLTLAVDELATNIVIHGYEEAGRTAEFVVSYAVTPEALQFVLEDCADPFDPRQLATPKNLDAAPEDRAIGGLGVYLALKSVDGFDYRRNGERNLTTLTMHRQAPSAAK